MTTLPPHWTKVGMTRIVHCVTNIENINSGIQFYCKENNKKHQHFLENNKILNIVFKKLYIRTYIPKSIVKVTMDFGMEVRIYSFFKTIFKILLFSKKNRCFLLFSLQCVTNVFHVLTKCQSFTFSTFN